MKCNKCNGIMSKETFYDYDTGESFIGYRCVNCGKITDPVIVENGIQHQADRIVHELDTMMEMDMID